MNTIEVIKLNKSFGNVKVLNNLSFVVGTGEIFAFLGENGSGKTTTIRCMLHILAPDSGSISIFGKEFSIDISEKLGYLPEERGLYLNSKVLETIVYFGQLKGLSSNDAKNKGIKLLEYMQLSDKINQKIKNLSSGQQQKIQLIITVINDPTLLILDEPTKGLDPVNRALFMDILFSLNKENGTSILFSTHQMDEAERIAKKVLMIKDGNAILNGDLEEIKQRFGDNTVKVEYEGVLKPNEKLFTGKIDTNFAELKYKTGSSQDVLEYIIKQGIVIKKFEVANPSLNEIFLKVAKNEQ